MGNNLAKSRPSTSPPGFSFLPGIGLVYGTLDFEVLFCPPHPLLGTSLLRPFSRQFLVVTIVSALRMPHILANSLLPFPMSSHLSPVFRVILLQQRSTAEKENVGY